MEQKYSEIISKYGPLFKNLKYIERLNLDDTSLVGEKWTTELFADDIEVMPIILENEEYSQQDRNENDGSSEVGLKTNNDLHNNDIQYLVFEKEQVHNHTNMKQSLNNDQLPVSTYFTEFGNDHPQNSNIGGPEKTLAIIRPRSFDSSSFNFTKTYSDEEPNANIVDYNETEVLFIKKPEHSTDNRNQTMYFQEDASKPYVGPSVCLLDKVEACTNLLGPSKLSGKHISSHRGEAAILDIPKEFSYKRSLHGVSSGRIARPLSLKYFLEKKGETKIRPLKGKKSVMDLTNRKNENNMNLSSMYDELCAASMEQTQKYSPKTYNRLKFALDLCNTESSDMTILTSERFSTQPDIPKPCTSGIKDTETTTGMSIKDCSIISRTNIYSATDRIQDSINSNLSDDSLSGLFLPLLEKEENVIQKKNPEE